MLKRLMGLGLPAVALAALMIVAQPASAQRFGGFGLGTGWGHGWGYAPTYNYGYSPYYSSYSPYGYSNWSGYNTSYYPGWNNWNTGWNNSYYYPSTYTYSNWGYPNSYSNYYYGHEPNYYFSGVNTYNTSNMMPNQTVSFYSADHMFQHQNVPQTAALITVRVPPHAQIWFSDHKTNEQGHMRQFVTPSLDKDNLFYYMLRASWDEGNGRKIDRSQKVLVRAGDRINVDFNRDIVTVDEMTPYRFQGQTQSGYEGTEDQNQLNRIDQFNRNNPERVPSTPQINLNNNNTAPRTTPPAGTNQQTIPAPRNNNTNTTPSGSNSPTTTSPNR
jgi:uncharacterized protein (TIGR03000 family)